MTLFSGYYKDKFFWFRICGRGLSVKHVKHGLLFSQRNGIKKILRVGNYYISILPKRRKQQ